MLIASTVPGIQTISKTVGAHNNNNMQFLYSAVSLPKLAQSALHIIIPGRSVTHIWCDSVRSYMSHYDDAMIM